MKRKVLILLLILIIVLSSCVGGGSDPSTEPTTERHDSCNEFEVTNIKNIDIAKSGVIPDYIDMNQAPGLGLYASIQTASSILESLLSAEGMNSAKEDFAVLSYNPDTEELKFHGTFMNAAKEARHVIR